MSENQSIKKTADELCDKVMTGNFVKKPEISKEEQEAIEEAKREMYMLDDNEDSLKWRFRHG